MKIRMFRLILTYLGLLFLLSACGLFKEDLEQARSHFKTELIKKLPSPEDYSYYFPPEGVRVTYYKSGSLRLKAWIAEKVTGDSKQKLPAIVYAHGGFSFSLADWQEAKIFTEAGFILLTPMLRGENGNPGYFEFFYGEVDDLLAAGNYLASLQRVDKEKIFLVGYDTGGTLAMLCSMVKNPFHTIIAIGPTPDQHNYIKSYWQSAIPFNLNDPLELKLRSPSEYVFSIKTPLYLLVGDLDLVAKEKSLQFAQMAYEQQKTCEAEVIIGDHFSSLRKAVARSLEICRSHIQTGLSVSTN